MRRHRNRQQFSIALSVAGVLAIGALGIAGPAGATAPIQTPLSPHVTSIDLHGGYVAAGTGLRNRGNGSVHIAGIPAGATVVRAYLYWAVDAQGTNAGTSFPTGKVDGNPVTGTLLGRSTNGCDLADSWAYRADVTSLVDGNGDHRLTSFRETLKDGTDPTVGAPVPAVDGASLVVVYSKASYPATRIVLADGNVKSSSGASTTLAWGFPATDPVPEVRTTFIGGGGEDRPGPVSTFNGYEQTKAAWDGSDPQTGARYTHGNRWDTDTVSVGRRVRPGDTAAVVSLQPRPDSECVDWVAQVLSIGVDGAADTDHDGLLDGWEANGNDADGNGTYDVNLQSMGASVVHKDVFVEMDSMGAESVCPCHLPLAPDLDRIVAAFATSPYADNPDGKPGIALHLDAGPFRGARYDLGGGNVVPHDDDLNPVNTEFPPLKAANFSPLRARTFHYMIWAHGYDGGTSSGLSFGIGADSFIVTLGKWADHGSSDAKVGTFIHELGHNLGLGHGGNDLFTNYKPNYLSVMNYFFQVSGVPQSGGRAPLFSYSQYKQPTLDEHRLDERAGLPSARADGFETRWFCPDDTIRQTTGPASGPVDWNCDGVIANPVATDINNDDQQSTFGGWRDWGNLTFTGGTIGADGPGTGTRQFIASTPMPHELTYEESLRLAR